MNLEELYKKLDEIKLPIPSVAERDETPEHVRSDLVKMYEGISAIMSEVAKEMKEPQPAQAEIDWLGEAASAFDIASDPERQSTHAATLASAAAAIAQVKAAERQADALEELVAGLETAERQADTLSAIYDIINIKNPF